VSRRAKPAATVNGVHVNLDEFVTRGRDRLPGLLGIEIESIENGTARMHLHLRPELLAPNGYLHAATVVALADSACGYGCIASLPDGATGFTTIELKTNFLATALAGTLSCESRRIHGGRTTQVWDATVTDEAGKTLALFRCTQLLLYAQASA
jgi:uncharacterized protein (TIGR00369 family)